jgi:predicted ester cyclase
MSAEENKALARRELEEIFDARGNLDAAEEIYAPNYISHQPAGQEDIRGVQAIKEFAAGMRQAFPDSQVTIEEQIAEGDRVLTRFRTRGSHQGELWGIPPTGREVQITNMSLCRIEGGRMVEEWPAPDRLGMMQQLGVIEQPSG